MRNKKNGESLTDGYLCELSEPKTFIRLEALIQ
jgi:hypothetical protein